MHSKHDLHYANWIFRSLMLPYKSSSHSAKCVRCASLRSGGRRLAVRTAMEHPIGALPRTPFASSRRSPQGETRVMREKQRVIYFTYHFGVFPLWWLSPLPCPVGSMSCDTESKSRNAGFILIAQGAIPQPSAPQALSPPERSGPQPFYTTRGASRAPFF